LTQSSSDNFAKVDDRPKPGDWTQIFASLWTSRKPGAYFVGGVAVISIIISLLLPNYYRSTATLLPETEKSKLSSLGALSDLAALAGMSVGGDVSLAKLYPTIIKSESVLKNVIYTKYTTLEFNQPVDLIQYWEIREKAPERSYEIALNYLREQLDVNLDTKTNVATISIATKEPKLSADIVNNVTAELDKFIRTKRISNASEQRKWIEARLGEVKQDLEKSENALKDFREKNRQVSGSPQLLLEQERFIREVQINSTLYTELKKQYEIVRIEEIKNIPIINVMDEARPAARKESPSRAVIVLVSVVMSMAMVVLFLLVNLRYGSPIKKFNRFFVTVTKGGIPGS